MPLLPVQEEYTEANKGGWLRIFPIFLSCFGLYQTKVYAFKLTAATHLSDEYVFCFPQTFLTLSLQDMASRVQLSGPQEAEKYVLHMVSPFRHKSQ